MPNIGWCIVYTIFRFLGFKKTHKNIDKLYMCILNMWMYYTNSHLQELFRKKNPGITNLYQVKYK